MSKTKTTKRGPGRPGNRAMQFAARFCAMTQGYTENHARALLREDVSNLSAHDWYVIARALSLPSIETVEDFTDILQELGVGKAWRPR